MLRKEVTSTSESLRVGRFTFTGVSRRGLIPATPLRSHVTYCDKRDDHRRWRVMLVNDISISLVRCTFRPIPDREYVDAYIKAYYLPDAQLEMWIREHKVRNTIQ